MSLPAFACSVCGAIAEAYALKCSSCGKGVVCRVRKPVPVLSIVRPVEPTGLTKADPNVKEPVRVSLGLETLDRAMGLNADGRGGFVVGSSVTCAGDPGAGKSTLAILVGEAFQRSGRSAIYCPSESNHTMFSLMVKRTGLGKDLDIYFSQSVTDILAMLEARRPDLAMVDSLHSLEPRADALIHAKRLMRFVDETHTSLLLVGERAKGGGTMRGDWGIEYQGEVVIGLEKTTLVAGDDSKKDPLASLRRWLVVSKNRHGGCGAYPLLLTERGWSELPLDVNAGS